MSSAPLGTFDAIFARRSISRLGPPAPDQAELARILEAAEAAPDHGELRGRRFTVLKGSAKDDFGAVLAEGYQARARAAGGEPTGGQLRKEATKLGRAPVVVVVSVVRQDDEVIPWVEQQEAGAAAAQNALLAATALGYGSMWRTGDAAYDPVVKAALGLAGDDFIVGFLYFGTPEEDAAKPPRHPDLAGLVQRWDSRPGGEGG